MIHEPRSGGKRIVMTASNSIFLQRVFEHHAEPNKASHRISSHRLGFGLECQREALHHCRACICLENLLRSWRTNP